MTCDEVYTQRGGHEGSGIYFNGSCYPIPSRVVVTYFFLSVPVPVSGLKIFLIGAAGLIRLTTKTPPILPQ